MIWAIAWKNVWRNKKRSLVVIIAVSLGIIAGVLLVGIMEGWVKQRLHDAISNEVSHIQIHNNEFLKNEEIDFTIHDPDRLAAVLDSMPAVSAWTGRTKLVAMAGTPWANTGVFIYGIIPEKEKKVTEIYTKLISGAGTYLASDKPGEILISDKTAQLLKLKQYIVTDSVMRKLEKDKVSEPVLKKLSEIIDTRFRSPDDFRLALKHILTRRELDRSGMTIMEEALDYRIRNKVQITLSDLQGNPVQGIFRVAGIYKTTNTGFDQASVFVNTGDLRQLYGGHEILWHEFSIFLKDEGEIDAVKAGLEKLNTANIVNTWKELAPDAAMMNDFMILYYFIYIGIIMLALAFGIINTMLMSILERTRELGMLMAIGMNRRRVFSMIMLETIFLTMVGAIIGMLLGWLIASLLARTGIHFSGWGEGFEAIGFAAVVYPVVKPGFLIFTTVMVIVTAITASIWPARKALKLIPVEALRTE